MSKYISKKNTQEYFNMESLDKLHALKLYADNMYYNEGKDSGISDYQYDILKDTLTRRDPNYIVPIGAKIREGENRVKLPFWLGSMDKIKPEDTQALSKWQDENKSNDYIIQDKLDGVSCLIAINKGKISIYTRGDGIIGADISYLLQYLNNIPKKLSKVTINIRGELIIPIDVFNKKYSKEYANPRNMVTGCIGAKKLKNGLSDIKFIAYEIVGDGLMKKPSEQLEYLDTIGFTIVKHERISFFTVDNLMETLLRFKKNNTFEIDGIIVQSNKEYIRNVDGNPDYAFAFKMLLSDNIIETKVIGVEWNVSKWGQLKPRVAIEPVKLGGVTINYTTGFNGKYIYDNKIAEGSVIKITRSGDVIPYIVEVVTQSNEPDMPDLIWKWNDTHVDIIVEDGGDTMNIKLIASFFAKLSVKHLGEKSVEKMYYNGLDTILKIVSASKERISQVDGFGDKGSERIYDGLRKELTNLHIPTVLGAAAIFGFGIAEKKIDKLFIDMPNILHDYKKMSNEELYDNIMKVEGFSNKTTKCIVNNMEDADKFIVSLGEFVTYKQKVIMSNNMKDMKVVFSGFRDSELENNVLSKGGKMVSSISSNTSILVVNNLGSVTSKIKKAQDLGIEILEKQDFIYKYIDNN